MKALSYTFAKDGETFVVRWMRGSLRPLQLARLMARWFRRGVSKRACEQAIEQIYWIDQWH